MKFLGEKRTFYKYINTWFDLSEIEIILKSLELAKMNDK